MALTAEQKLRLAELEAKELTFKKARLAELEAKASAQGSELERKRRRMAELERKERLASLGDVGSFLSDVVKATVKPFTRVPEIYMEEISGGVEGIKEGGVGGKALGLLQYVYSPITAVSRAFVGEPVEETTTTAAELLGASPETARTIGSLTGTTAEIAAGFAVPGYVGKAIEAGKAPGLKALEKLGRKGVGEITPNITGKPAKSLGAGKYEPPIAAKEAAAKLKAEGKLFTPQVAQKVTDDIAEAATTALEGNVDESKRLFRNVAGLLERGEIDVEGLPEILAKHKLTPEQFAAEYTNTISTAGRQLNQLSKLSKRLKEVFKNNPEAVTAFEKWEKTVLESGPSIIDKIDDTYVRVENFRRGLLVTQVATSVRNAASQAGRITLSMFDEALQEGMLGGRQGNMLQEVGNGFNAAHAFISRLKPAGRARLLQILESDNAVISKMRLLSQPVHEVTLGNKITSVLNTLNRGQEFFFRKLAFEAKLRQLLTRRGLDFEKINPSAIPEELFTQATDYALEMTFAASPKSNFGKEIVRAWTRIPGLTTINPFPRFNFANAVPFILDHSPLGYGRALLPSTLKKLGSGNPEEFVRAASRATIGTTMFMSAWHMRQSKYAGEKWYEIKAGDKTIDTRAFAPFSTYLFFAEAFQNPHRLNPADYIQAAVGLNRIAGSGLVVVDLFRAKTGENAKQILDKFAGQYAGSFSVPARTAKDFYAGVDPEEAVFRDTRENPLVAPFLQNIPEVSQLLPEQVSPLKSKRVKSDSPVLRQLTGLSTRTKTAIEQEVDRIGLEFTSIYPRTSVPKADRKMAEYMGPIVEQVAPIVLGSPKYQSLSDAGKRIVLGAVFKAVRADARKLLKAQYPNLALKIRIERFSNDEKQLLKEQGINLK